MKVGPRYKICRRLGDSVFGKCQTQKFQIAQSKRVVKGRGRRKAKTEYGSQLTEKQKIKYSYYISEKQLSNYVKKARSQKNDPTKVLFSSLEARLDNLVFRSGLVPTRAFARQVVSHGHITVNGGRVTIPSYSIKTGDVISIREGSKGNKIFTGIKDRLSETLPSWLLLDPEKLTVTVQGAPVFEERSDLVLDFNAAIEFYSRV